MGVEPGTNMYGALQREDSRRVGYAERKISVIQRNRQQVQRLQRKTKKSASVDYLLRGFGLPSQPHCITKKRKKALPDVAGKRRKLTFHQLLLRTVMELILFLLMRTMHIRFSVMV